MGVEGEDRAPALHRPRALHRQSQQRLMAEVQPVEGAQRHDDGDALFWESLQSVDDFHQSRSTLNGFKSPSSTFARAISRPASRSRTTCAPTSRCQWATRNRDMGCPWIAAWRCGDELAEFQCRDMDGAGRHLDLRTLARQFV